MADIDLIVIIKIIEIIVIAGGVLAYLRRVNMSSHIDAELTEQTTEAEIRSESEK